MDAERTARQFEVTKMCDAHLETQRGRRGTMFLEMRVESKRRWRNKNAQDGVSGKAAESRGLLIVRHGHQPWANCCVTH